MPPHNACWVHSRLNRWRPLHRANGTRSAVYPKSTGEPLHAMGGQTAGRDLTPMGDLSPPLSPPTL